MVRAISEKQTANLAAKTDLVELRTKLIETGEFLRNEISDLRNEVWSEMAALALRLTEKMASIYTKVVIWLVGTALASISLVAASGQLLK